MFGRLVSVIAASLAFVVLLVCSAAAEDDDDGPFGAIAFDKTGAYGWSKSFTTEDIATERALEECRKHSPNADTCALIRKFKDTCVTMARNEIAGKAHITWAEGQTKTARSKQTMSECRNKGGRACKILKEFCTGSAKDG